MISDVLSDASASIKEYLNSPSTSDCYQGEMRERILKLLKDMDLVRQELDAPPPLKKKFKTSTVLTLHTGLVLDDSFAPASELADFLFPGIGPIGMAAMQQQIKRAIEEQHPEVATLLMPHTDAASLKKFVKDAERVLGKELEIKKVFK
jgi:hypothetical protein